jgi:hypothetical protein
MMPRRGKDGNRTVVEGSPRGREREREREWSKESRGDGGGRFKDGN